MSKYEAHLYSMSKIPAPKLAKLFMALAVDARIRIIRNIARYGTFGAWKAKQGRGCTIKEAGDGLNIGWPTLSHHVSVLEEAGMIKIEKKGRTKRCWISQNAAHEISKFFMSLGPRKVSDKIPEDVQKKMDIEDAEILKSLEDQEKRQTEHKMRRGKKRSS